LLIYTFNQKLIPAKFIKRLNKFLVEVTIGGKTINCHLHDPGRLKEILQKGRKLLLLRKEGKRKTKYDVIAAYMEEWFIIHSGYHSILTEKILKNKLIKNFEKYKIERKEFKYGSSRIDFLLKNDKTCLLEVKGCTLVKNGIALFPDAPTLRGRRHIIELMNAKKEGYDAAILFLVMRPASSFSPNWEIDEKFATSLKTAHKKGVKIIACRIKFDGKNVYYEKEIPVDLNLMLNII